MSAKLLLATDLQPTRLASTTSTPRPAACMGISGRKKPKFDVNAYDSVVAGVKQVYLDKVRHLEEQYLTHVFHQPLLNDRDWDAKPMVLLVGQYSTGKTSFIKYLLDCDFPGMHLGPEPTTDKFQVRSPHACTACAPHVHRRPGFLLHTPHCVQAAPLTHRRRSCMGRRSASCRGTPSCPTQRPPSTTWSSSVTPRSPTLARTLAPTLQP